MSFPVSTYDRVLYPGHAYVHSHPDRLATLAALHGLRPASVSACRVLELGCGVGANLIPVACQWPASEFTGIDLGGRAVAAGMARIADLGLANIRLVQQDILEVTASLGTFDYIIAHGVYSWVAAPVRDKLLAICGECLAPQGVAYVSYNSYPGSHLRNLVRDMMLYHVRAVEDAQEHVQQGRALLKFLAEASAANEVYGVVLRDQYERIRRLRDEVLFHDDLEDVSVPFFLYQVVEAAAAHGLQYLADAGLVRADRDGLPEAVRGAFERLPETAVVAREQYADFIRGQGFRRTLLCRADLSPRPSIDPQVIASCHIASSFAPVAKPFDPAAEGVAEFKTDKGDALSTDHRLTKAALVYLGSVWPRAVAFPDLVEAALAGLAAGAEPAETLDEEVAALRRVLLRAFAAGEVELHLDPPQLTTIVGERPRASRLARHEAATGSLVTNLRHGTVSLEGDLIRRLLQLADGTRTLDALVAEIAAVAGAANPVEGPAPPAGAVTRETVQLNLQLLAKLALLEG